MRLRVFHTVPDLYVALRGVICKFVPDHFHIIDIRDGYTLFAAKSAGFDYTYAFANAQIALFDGAKGAEIEFAGEANADKQKLAARYADENADPVNAAKNGYVDNIIEPQFVRQYLIASLQMLLK